MANGLVSAEMPLFTAENAADMARRATLARIRGRQAEQAELAGIPRETLEELEIVEEQIACTRKELNDRTPACVCCERPALQPHHRAQLLKALDALLERRRKLTGRFSPGTLRPQDKPKSPSRQVESDPQPTPVPCVPESSPGPQSVVVSTIPDSTSA